jgi:ribosome-associated protein
MWRASGRIRTSRIGAAKHLAAEKGEQLSNAEAVKVKDATEATDAKELALIAARAANDKKATDIVIQQVRETLIITDYFVIATGANNRQVDAIAEAVEDTLRIEAGVQPIGREGTDELSWVLLDFGDVVVHVFQPEVRDFYRLETLWADVPLVPLAAAGITDAVYSERVINALKLQ